ncbi:hypothetical protein GCM10009830_29570 [Glycomyces endophyticus]|uniref:Uncharacterized protein n=1 Tax=Glycomyces endophyticus TaxID=480996 RepID=A0ABP4T144_9ACTN
MRARSPLGPLVAAALLVAAGCSGDTGREFTAAEQAIVDRLGETPSAETDPAETEAARNEFVAECMAEDDLEYLGPAEALSMTEWLGLTDEQFAAEYGFGHSTTIDLSRAYEDFVYATAEEQRAAFEALPADDRDRYRPSELGCLERSYGEFGFPADGNVYLPNDSPINEYIEQASAATADDPRLAEATEAWSNCMAEQGYDFANRDDMGLPLQEEAQTFIEAYGTQGQPLIDAGQTWADLRVADVLDADQTAALEGLQQRELAASAAHELCIDEGHDIEATYAEVYDVRLAELVRS